MPNFQRSLFICNRVLHFDSIHYIYIRLNTAFTCSEPLCVCVLYVFAVIFFSVSLFSNLPFLPDKMTRFFHGKIALHANTALCLEIPNIAFVLSENGVSGNDIILCILLFQFLRKQQHTHKIEERDITRVLLCFAHFLVRCSAQIPSYIIKGKQLEAPSSQFSLYSAAM